MYCQLPPDTGRCHARYIRWYFNSNAQECTHFQYGGCEGNQNNFMSKKDCEQTCLATPAIKLYENGYSALLQPSIVSAPVYDNPKSTNYEALNSVHEPASNYDRVHLTRHRITRPTKNEQNNSRTRRRLEKEKEKEKKERKRKDREMRKELKRLRRLRKKEQKKQKKREQRLKERKEKKKKTGISGVAELFEEDNKMMRDNSVDEDTEVVKQTKDITSSKNDAEKERRRNDKRRERKRLKRRERRKRRLEKERKKQDRLAKLANTDSETATSGLADLLKKSDSSVSSEMFAALDQGKKSQNQKQSEARTTWVNEVMNG